MGLLDEDMNEPGHVKAWHAIKDAYIQFNLRTARLRIG